MVEKSSKKKIKRQTNTSINLKLDKSLFDNFWDLVLIIDTKGRVIYANNAIKRYGYKKSDIVGKGMYKFIPKRHWASVGKGMINLKKGKPNRNIAEIFRKNGDTFFVEYMGTPIKRDGKIVAFQSILRDITKQKVDNDLLENNKRFQDKIIDQTPNPMWISDGQGNVIRVNKALEKLLNLRQSEVVGRYNVLKDSQVEDQGFLKEVEDVYNKGTIAKFTIDYNTNKEKCFRHKKNVHKILDIIISPIKDSEGSVTNAICQHKDITGIKKAEEEYKNLINAMNDAAYVIGYDEKFKEVNNAAIKTLGYSRKEFLNMKGPQDIDPQLPPNVIKNLLLNSMDKIQIFETKHRTKDNRDIPVEISSSLVTYKGEMAILSIARNISERKRMENAIKESQDNFQNIIEHSNELFYVHDTNHVLTYLSPQCKEFLGYTAKEMLRKWTDVATDNPINVQGMKLTEKAFKTGEKQPLYNLELRRKDGRKIIVEVDESPIKDDKGNIIGVCGALRDVTEELFHKKQLEIANKKWQDLYDNMRDGWESTDFKGKFLECNNAYLKMIGYTWDELKKKTYQQITPKKWHKYERQILRDGLMATGYSGIYQKEYIRKDGTVFPVEINSYLTRDSDGNPIGKWSIARDITERKKYEKQLKDSERFFEDLYESSMMLSGDIDSVIDSMCEKLSDIFSSKYAMVNLISGNNILVRSSYRLPKLFSSKRIFPIDKTICKHLFESNKPLCISDLNTDICPFCGYKFSKIPIVRQLKLKSYLGAPVAYSDETVVGSLCLFFDDKKLSCSQRDIEIISLFAKRVANELEKEDANKALIESEGSYKALFEDAPVPLWEEDFSEVKNYIRSLRKKSVTDLKKFFETHKKELKNIGPKLRLINVNKATLKFFESRSKNELINKVSSIILDPKFKTLEEEVIAVAQNKRTFTTETTIKTLKGNKRNAILSWSVAPGHEKDWSKLLVSLIDITGQKMAELKLKDEVGTLERFKDATVDHILELQKVETENRKLKMKLDYLRRGAKK